MAGTIGFLLRRPALLGALLLTTLALAACTDRDAASLLGPDGPSMQVASAPVVNSLADPGDGTCDETECTLREAIAFASDGATITFNVTGTITLAATSGRLTIEKPVVIQGPGAAALAVSGDSATQVMGIYGVVADIRGLTLRDGWSSYEDGGGLRVSNATVTLDSVVVRDNTRSDESFTYGGGISAYAGTLTIRNSVIADNTATASTVSRGGGIANMYATLQIENSTVSGNTAVNGGGIQNSGTLALLNSTVSGNTATAGYGGGFYTEGVLVVAYSTVSGNTAGMAGGILAYTGDVDLVGALVAGNIAVEGVAPDLSDSNPITTATYSLIGDATGHSITDGTSGNIVGSDPLLGSLADNGGPTQTHALGSGSPAIDHIPAGEGYCGSAVTSDQRGVDRPQGDACDIGAFEKEAPVWVVNTLEDHQYDGCDAEDCTLREALVDAPSGSTITFGVTGTILLEMESDLPVFKDLVIAGPGARELTVDADGGSRVFSVSDGTVTISGLTITGGYTATGGGGINNSADLTIVDCAISGNVSTTSRGGGIINRGTLRVESSTISENWGPEEAGGVSSQTTASTTFINSTISGNLAYPGGAAADGVYASSGVLRITHSTITGNRVGVNVHAGSAQIRGSILSGNTVRDVDANTAGLATSLGYNLVGSASNATFAADGDQTGVTDAGLGPLQVNYPGATRTHALGLGSPAIDAGTCTDDTGETVATDQRGVDRPQGSTCDIGAYEKVGGTPKSLVVNSLDDPGTGGCDATECTLREAIESSSPGDTITFETGLVGTVELIGQLQLYWELSIVGPGAEYITLDANGTVDTNRRAFAVGSTADISGLTVTGGYATDGAGIWNDGTLTLSDMVVTGNVGEGDGGGIYNSGALTVSYSTVASNTGTYGAGIANSGTLMVDHSAIADNEATPSYGMGGLGGGIHSSPDAGTTTVSNSTISGNAAACRGGGIDNQKVIRIEHTTITGNTTASNIAGNGCGGGGLHSYSGAGEGAQIVGSIIWGNLAGGTAEDVADLSSTGALSSLGHNLIGAAGAGVDFSVEFVATGDQTNVSDTETVLDALALNSPGTTATHALPVGSRAIDAGTCTGLDATVGDDQRGVSRPQGDHCDIGAYETTATGGPTTPEFTFDLSGLATNTYGDSPFSIASYATTNSSGAITFALGTGSTGCSVSAGGDVTITGAAVDPAACIIEASLAAAGSYTSAGPISQSFHIAKAATTVSISNLPASGGVTGGFTPEYTSTSDGAKSTTSSTPQVCTYRFGYVSFVGAGTCLLTAHVEEGTSWLAADGGEQYVEIAGLEPEFTFDLTGLSKTYGDAPFSVASYATTNSSGAITFALGAGSTGCSVSIGGDVTITGAAVDPVACMIEASLAPASPYAGAGPISQSFDIAKASPSVTIENVPSSGVVGDGFTPTVVADGDGATSVTSSTTDVCTVDGAGAVSFLAAGTCILVAHVAAGTNYLAANGADQSFPVVEGGTGEFASSCTFRIHPRSGQMQVFVEWANAAPGVSLVELENGITVSKELTPEATGTYTANLKGEDGTVSYRLWGAERRKDDPTPLMPMTVCTEVEAPVD